jgi:hypothetical protein
MATRLEDIENLLTTVTLLFYILHMSRKICAVGVASTRTKFTPSFHKISQLVQKFKWTYKVKAEIRTHSFSSISTLCSSTRSTRKSGGVKPEVSGDQKLLYHFH